ncbi:MAG: hypothetical protein KA388_08650, partial [Rhodocyclaceae bacterium]|nr:hypothetical protein [Rhodocyclaceae bacterium]
SPLIAMTLLFGFINTNSVSPAPTGKSTYITTPSACAPAIRLALKRCRLPMCPRTGLVMPTSS